MIALITGGSGSGKSAYAEKLAASLPGTPRLYLATMQPYDDEETRQRIARHRAMRAGKGFDTMEQALDLASAPIPENSCVLLECLPNLVANEMFDGGRIERVIPALDELMNRCASLVIVTDNVFCDGIPYSDGTADWLRCMAETAAHVAAKADFVVEVVCGIPVAMKGELPCI